MKTLTLAEAHALLSSASAALVHDTASGDHYFDPSPTPLDQPQYPFLAISNDWLDHSFNHDRNQLVLLNDSSIVLKDADGRDVVLTLLFPRNLESTLPAPAGSAPESTTTLDHLVKGLIPLFRLGHIDRSESGKVKLIATEDDYYALKLALDVAERELARRSVGHS